MNIIRGLSFCRLILSAVKTKIPDNKIVGFIQFPYKGKKKDGGKKCCKAQQQPRSEFFVAACVQTNKYKE